MNRGYYRKKPIPVLCEQFIVNSTEGWPLGVYEDSSVNESEGTYFIDTLEGRMRVNEGDWIVTGVKGERYCIASDVFELSYEYVYP